MPAEDPPFRPFSIPGTIAAMLLFAVVIVELVYGYQNARESLLTWTQFPFAALAFGALFFNQIRRLVISQEGVTVERVIRPEKMPSDEIDGRVVREYEELAEEPVSTDKQITVRAASGTSPRPLPSAMRDIENRALERFTRAFDANVNQNVRYQIPDGPPLEFDAVIDRSGDSDTIVEVRWIKDPSWLPRLARQISKFRDRIAAYERANKRNAYFVLLLVVPEYLSVEPTAFKPAFEAMQQFDGDWELHWYSYEDLGLEVLET